MKHFFHALVVSFSLLLAGGTLYAGDFDSQLQDLTITIPGHISGLMGKAQPDDPVVYQVKGINFVTSTSGGVKTKYSTDFASPPVLPPDYKSDPFKIVESLGYLEKQHDQAGIRKLMEPDPDPRLLEQMSSPDLLKWEDGIYGNARGMDILFLIKDGDNYVVYYTVQTPARPALQMEALIRIGSSFFIKVQEAASDDYMPVNIFTAFREAVNGISGDVTIAP